MFGVVADNAHATYNISSKLGSFFSIPSRLIARIRKIDDMIYSDLEINTFNNLGGVNEGRIMDAPARYDLPGPWAFVTSGYAVGLLAMALLLNRIQHVVVPPRRSLAHRFIRSRRSIFHAAFHAFFPINLSSTACRLTLRIPSLYFLFRSLILLAITLLQTSGFWPSWDVDFLHSVSAWASQMEFADICWSTFGAVCAALSVGALTRGLEGLSTTNNSPFNLFGYAFLLHIYSVPVTHLHKGPPSRPDKHVIITIIIPLLLLTMQHFLGIKKRWSRQRLVPTTICSVLTLVHFHAVLLTNPMSYPLLNYLPCLLESLLVLVTLLTCTLNALTQLLLEGAVRQPLFGHAQSLAPKADEDFAVVLLRLGTASLEATSVAGLGYEVTEVRAAAERRAGRTHDGPTEGVVELCRGGVVSVSTGERGKERKEGFMNEIRSVRVSSAAEGDWWFHTAWYRGLARFIMGLVVVARGTWALIKRHTWYRLRGHTSEPLSCSATLEDRNTASGFHQNAFNPGTLNLGDDDEDVIYRRFLEGESVSDDDDEYIPNHRSNSVSPSPSPYESHQPSENDSDSDTGDEASGDVAETANLYTDLLQTTPSSLLIMSTPSTARLTRRRYSQLVANRDRPTGADPTHYQQDMHVDKWDEFVQDRRNAVGHLEHVDDGMLETRRNCVICTAEPRQVICWPCRCLTMCDDCRANLASRFAASQHSCPCCRRSVEGYSRIFIP